MKKVSIFAITLVAIISFTISGCKKNDVKTQSSQQNTATTNPGSFLKLGGEDNWADAANEENPNDNVGLIHNQCLKYICDNISVEGLQDVEEVYTAAATYQMNTFGTSLSNSYSLNEAQSFYSDLSVYETAPSLDYVIGLTPLSTTSKNYLEELLQDIYPGSSESYATIKSLIVSWESGISDLAISNTEKSMLYNIGSVLRYSIFAWDNAVIPNSTAGNVQFKVTLWRWLAAAVFDAVGSIATPIAGAIGSAGAFAICTYNGWY